MRRALGLLAVSVLVSVAVAPIATGAPSSRADARHTAASVKRQLVGTWRLVSFAAVNEQGTTTGYPYGQRPAGKLTYTAAGQIWAYTGEGGQAKTARNDNWYTGTFTVDTKRRTVNHRVQYSSIRDWEGELLVRKYQFNGPRKLTLTTLLAGPEGAQSQLVLVWHKVAS